MGLQSKCYLLSTSFEQLRNKIGIAESNFNESMETIENQKSEILTLKDSLAKLEVENSELKAGIERHENSSEDLSNPTTNNSSEILRENDLKCKLSESELNRVRLESDKAALETTVAELNIENRMMKEKEKNPSQNQEV
jgi:hypothetical protein